MEDERVINETALIAEERELTRLAVEAWNAAEQENTRLAAEYATYRLAIEAE